MLCARESAAELLIAHLKLQIVRLRRKQFGASAERSRRLLDQLELQREDLEADAGEDGLAAEAAGESGHESAKRSRCVVDVSRQCERRTLAVLAFERIENLTMRLVRGLPVVRCSEYMKMRADL